MTAQAQKLTPLEKQRLRAAEERREYIAKLLVLFLICAVMVALFYIGHKQSQENSMTCEDNSLIDYAGAGRSSLTSFGLCH